MDIAKHIVPHNITKEESKAITSLKKREDIVIKPADKGGAVCVWNKDSYIEEGNTQLSDTKFYKEFSSDITDEIQREIEKEIGKMIKEKKLPSSAENLIVKFIIKIYSIYTLMAKNNVICKYAFR